MRKKFVGLNKHRLEYDYNALERSFAEEWSKMNGGKTLDYLMTPIKNDPNYAELSDQDHLVAATIIQWLGTPVGQGFIRDAQKKADWSKLG